VWCDSAVDIALDSQFGGTGMALHAQGSPNLLSFWGRKIGTSFKVNGSAPLTQSSLIELRRIANARLLTCLTFSVIRAFKNLHLK